jgi:hypothetical protein
VHKTGPAHRKLLAWIVMSNYLIISPAALSAPNQPRKNPPYTWTMTSNRLNVPKPQGLEDIRPLKDMPDLPQLPQYSGKPKFLYGSEQSRSGGMCYMIALLAKETPERVRDWYVSAFRGYGWTIKASGPSGIEASHKDGHRCRINAGDDITHPGYKTRFQILYTAAAPK